MSEKEILMKDEIESKRKLSQEAKDKMNGIIFLNFNISSACEILVSVKSKFSKFFLKTIDKKLKM